VDVLVAKRLLGLTVFGRTGKSPVWVEKIMNSRIGFLSSICLGAAHIDLLRGSSCESTATLAARCEVLRMIADSTKNESTRTSDLTVMYVGIHI
jgi:hypothetical protein